MTVKKADQLVWVCEACQRPIADGKGGVFVRISERRAYRDDRDARKRKRAADTRANPGRHFVLVSLSEIRSWTSHAPWHTLHHKCDPTPGDCSYWFDVARVRTILDVLSMTHHLLEKRWLDETDWRELIGRVLYDPVNSAARDEQGRS